MNLTSKAELSADSRLASLGVCRLHRRSEVRESVVRRLVVDEAFKTMVIWKSVQSSKIVLLSSGF